MMVGPVFVVRLILDNSRMLETGQILNIYGMIHNYPCILCPVYLFMVIMFILCIDAILNDVLTCDVIKNKAPKFMGHSTSGCQFQCFKKLMSYFNVSSFYYIL